MLIVTRLMNDNDPCLVISYEYVYVLYTFSLHDHHHSSNFERTRTDFSEEVTSVYTVHRYRTLENKSCATNHSVVQKT